MSASTEINNEHSALWICLDGGLSLVFDHVIVEPSVFQIKQCWKILVNEARIYCIKPLRFEESNFTVRIWSIRSTEKYAYNMYVITVNLRKFQFLWIKTSLFVSAQRHDLSSYARLWRMNRQKKQITAFRKLCTVEPAASIQKFKRMVSRPWNACVHVERKFNSNLLRSLNRSLNTPKTKSS